MASCVQSFGEERCNAGALDVPSEKQEEPCTPSTSDTEACQIPEGGYITINGRPGKVSAVSTSKTGKHGHAKCKFTARSTSSTERSLSVAARRLARRTRFI